MVEAIKKFNRSFSHAMDGLKYAIKFERNFRIEIMFSILVIALILIFRVREWETVILIVMMMWVLAMELINTVFERVVDMLKPRVHPYARLIKDVMASAVLLSSIAAFIIGLIIFFPYFEELFFG
jgi:undecaprenol kinase